MSLTPDMMPAWELREHLKQRDEQITALRAEKEQLRIRLKRTEEISIRYEAEVERLRAALEEADGALLLGMAGAAKRTIRSALEERHE